MAELKWIDVFECGVPEIDREHMEIIDCINEIIDYSERDDHLAAKVGCEKLRGKLTAHFKSEEATLAEHRFPRIAEHIRAHRDTMHHVKKLLGTCGFICKEEPPKECLQIWRSIILDHFIYGDVDFKSFLESRN